MVDEVIALLADRRGFPARLFELASRRATPTVRVAHTGQEQAQPERSCYADHDADEEHRAGRAGHLEAEHREPIGERMLAARVTEYTRDTDDHCG